MSGGATAGSGRDFRLDPSALPVRSATGVGGKASFYLDRQQAVLRQPSCGPAAMVTIPVDEYDGVAVRIAQDTDTAPLVLELAHRNPAYAVPLSRGGAPEDIADDWQTWGRELRLPLLVVSPDGHVARYHPGQLFSPASNSAPNRRHSLFSGRRPRFLTRRKIGNLDRMERLTPCEIIARN